MTPMIDVVFLLLIFFVCTASFQMAEAILPTSLLAAGTAPSNLQSQIEPPPEQVVVRATLQNGQPRWAVDERLCATLLDVRTVLAAVFEIDASVPVILDMDGDMPLGHAIDVYDLCRLIGFDRIQFAASIE
ncbi:MAG: biopolymer transporter ExbD [Pirellulales bacterium]|nr:biopolymer transporter ExbD [Pirellulales bacterium]